MPVDQFEGVNAAMSATVHVEQSVTTWVMHINMVGEAVTKMHPHVQDIVHASIKALERRLINVESTGPNNQIKKRVSYESKRSCSC